MLDPIRRRSFTGPDVDLATLPTGASLPPLSPSTWPEHGVIVEKCGLYSLLHHNFTIGIARRWNTMVTELQQFKDDYDKNQPLWKVLPEFCQKHPRYERVGLRDLCQQIHDVQGQ